MIGGRQHGLRLALLLALGAGLSCASGEAEKASRDPGTPGPGVMPPGSSKPPAGSGGSSAGTGGASGGGIIGTGGSPGNALGGTTGSGTGGSAGAADGGAGPLDTAADAPTSPPEGCTVTLTPVSPQRWLDLPAGEGYKLRVEARAGGRGVPVKPTWRWQVLHSGREVPTVMRDGDPAVREFVTDLPGRYDINVELLDTTPPCRASAVASAQVPNQRLEVFRIRATPPAGRNLATLEVDVGVKAGEPASRILQLGSGRSIMVEAQDESGSALRSYYVRVTARTSADRFEGYVDSPRAGAFQARVDISQVAERYDVIIVPDSPVAGGPVPPAKLYTGLAASQFSPAADFKLDGGMAIAGSALVGTAPLVGAKVRLRAGLLPSTIGVTDAGGTFALRARQGRFEVRVVPPPGSGLPDALLPESSGIEVQPGAPQQLSLRYNEPVTAQLALRVLTPEGTVPSRPVEVILETIEGALPDVGAFTLAGGQTATAIGSVRTIRSTSAGAISFDKLPRARYRATVVPPEDLPGGAAITIVEFPVDSAEVTQIVTLARRSRILGRLLPAENSRGLTVRGLDMGQDGIRRAVTAVVDAEGRYQLPADPDRVYRLFVEPAPGRRIPRIPLVPVRARATDVTDEQRLPPGLPISGQAMDASPGAQPNQGLAGVIIQIFCLGSAPDCIDPSSPDLSNTPPIYETMSGPDGNYQLYVPDPGT